MTENSSAAACHLKRGQWIYHDDFQWKMIRTLPLVNHPMDRSLTLVREDLGMKKYRMEAGTWEKGRATVTSHLSVKNGEKFQLSDKPDGQFDWIEL